MKGNSWTGEFWENQNFEARTWNFNEPDINPEATTIIYRLAILHRNKTNSNPLISLPTLLFPFPCLYRPLASSCPTPSTTASSRWSWRCTRCSSCRVCWASSSEAGCSSSSSECSGSLFATGSDRGSYRNTIDDLFILLVEGDWA